MSVLRGSFRVRLAAIVVAAVALRLLYVLVLARDVPMVGDARFFHAQALLLARGHGYIEPFVFGAFDMEVPTASHPPLYPTVLAGLSLLGGESFAAQRSLGAFIGGAAIVVIALIGRRVGGERVGLVAAAVAALYPVLVAADGAPMSESLYGLLVGMTLLVALKQHHLRSTGGAAMLGALIALAALARSEALLLLVILGLPLALGGPRDGRLKRTLALAAAAVVVLAPWTIRNLSAFDRPTLISHNDSTVLAGANCPDTYRGIDLGGWRFDCISDRRTFREGVQAARWRSEGIDYALDNVDRWPVVVPVRVLRTWDFWQPRRQIIFGEGRDRLWDSAGWKAYFLMLPFALAGAVLLRRRDRGAMLIIVAPALLVTISSAIGYGVPRFRHAFELSFVVLVAIALVAIFDRVRERRGAAAAPAA